LQAFVQLEKADMPATWVLVADSSAARIFDAPSPTGALEEIASYAHAEGRMHERDMRTDEPGVTHDSAGYAKHGMEPKVKPKEQEAIGFARFLADRLESARSKSEIDRIILVAPPEFLGHLRNVLDDDARKIVDGEYNLNLVKLRPDEIRKHLPEKLYSVLATP
jgi:protein required for attachment to host cells